MRFQRLRKILRWTLRAVLALAVLLILFIFEENIRGRIMLARYKAELRANGEKLTLAEIDLPKIPKEGNDYTEITAVGQQLKVLQRSSEFNVWFVTRLRWTEDGRPIVRCRQPDLGVRGPGTTAGTGGRRSRAIPSIINDAGQTNCSEIAKQRPATNLVVQAGWAGLAKTVNAASNSLARLNVVLTDNVVAIPIDYAQGLDIRLPHWGEIRDIHNWLALTALQELHNGNIDAAIKNIALIGALTRICQQGRINLLQYERLARGRTDWILLGKRCNRLAGTIRNLISCERHGRWTSSSPTRSQHWRSNEVSQSLTSTKFAVPLVNGRNTAGACFQKRNAVAKTSAVILP